MLTLEMAIQKIQQLTPEKQKEVFQLIEDLEKKEDANGDFFEIAGIWENREITAKTLRQEAWKEKNQ